MDAWNIESARDINLPIGKRMRSLRRESGLISSVLRWTWWTSIRSYMAVYHRLAVIGRENLPKAPPYVLVANHASHLDALVLAAPLPWQLRDQVFPIAAGDVFFETPMTSAFSALLLNALPMWRKKCGPHALQELRDRLVAEACVFVLFPEGARSRDGTMLPFKKGLGMLVAGTPVPIVPCYLAGCFNALPPDKKMPRPRKITMTIGKPLDFSATSNDRAGWESLTQSVESAVKVLGDNSDSV